SELNIAASAFPPTCSRGERWRRNSGFRVSGIGFRVNSSRNPTPETRHPIPFRRLMNMNSDAIAILVTLSVALLVWFFIALCVSIFDPERKRLQQRLASDQRNGGSAVGA